jgi:outer membrane protein OmpA-like peptidoglycan-associated protein
VLLSGNEILLRLFGLTFESGSDEILPEHDVLLTKVQRAVQAFEGTSLRIEGHTDGRGSPAANRTLSQRRAIAVRDYLLSRLPISASRVAATGFGADRPIANNDTEAGRARNRRIEIVMTLPPAGGQPGNQGRDPGSPSQAGSQSRTGAGS